MIGVAFKGDETIIKSNQHVYQWDTGQKITVSGLGNSSINQVHFSFNGLKTAYPVNVTISSGTVTVNIPNIVLRYGKDVYMYLCIKNTNGTVVTIKTVIIPVIKRNMPENYMYDDNETVAVKLDELQTEIQRSTGVDTDHEERIVSLEEAKTNASGTTFDTLKERIDHDVTELNDDINAKYKVLFSNTAKIEKWSVGEITTKNLSKDGKQYSAGDDCPNSKRCRSDYFYMPAGSFIRISPNEELNDGVYVFVYDTNNNYVSNSGKYVTSYVAYEECYIRVVAKYKDERDVAEISIFKELCTVYYPKSIGVNSQPINEWLNLDIDSSGKSMYSPNRATTRFIYMGVGNELVSNFDVLVHPGMFIFIYDTNFNYIGKTGEYVTSYTANTECYVRVVSKYNDERDITDLSEFNDKVFLNRTATPKNENVKNYCISGDFTTYYHSIDVGSDTEDVVLRSTIDDIYNRIDTLMNNYPEYITKNLLGYGTSTDGEEDNTLPIYEYVINTDEPYGSRKIYNAPTILLQSGTHGDEKSTVYAIVMFMEELFNSEHDVVANIKSTFNFKIIPILNPYGFNNNTRVNARGVNINRNLGYRWDKISDTDKGTAPYSEQESCVIRDWLQTNNNAILYIDYHNMVDLSPYISYVNTPNVDIQNLYSSFIRQVTMKWRKAYRSNVYKGSVYGFVNNDKIPCTFNEAYYIAGIKYSCILEIAKQFGDIMYPINIMKMSIEQLVNFLASMIEHLK